MNKAGWNNPPPPGTEYEFPEEISHSFDSGRSSTSVIDQRHRQIVTKYTVSGSPTFQEERYLVAEKSRYSRSPDRRRRHRRSRSYSRRSRSHSRERHRRSRSRSRRRRRRYSSSRSRSRSHSSGRRTKHRKHASHRSRSRSRTRRKKSRRSRSRSASRSHSRSRSYRSDKDNKRSPKLHYADERNDLGYVQFSGDNRDEEDMKLDPDNPEEDDSDDQDDESDPNPIPFKNDGSFLEMFKKMQEEQKANDQSVQESAVKKPVLPCFGKRRGGKVLKTGIVAKVKNPDEEGENPQDAWSIYMQEVRKYKEVHCDDDSKTRPLVK